MSPTAQKAKVLQVVTRPGRGLRPYVVAQAKGVRGSVTFSLDRHVWQEKSMPTHGIYVYLDDIRENSGGWRANIARFWRPDDEQQLQQHRRRQHE